jgi:hypothetical protein
MLLFKQREEDHSSTIACFDTAAETHAALLPDRTSEELLAELQDLVHTHKRNRKGTIGMYIGGMLLYGLAFASSLVFCMERAPGNFAFLFLSIFGSLVFMGLGSYGALAVGRSFYKRSRERLHTIVPALAQRGEARALPLLLALMDVRYSGILMGQESRPVFLQALETLLSRITPEQFQELSRQQMWAVLTMLYFPDGGLHEVVADMAIRCGDSRTLEVLQKLQRLYTFGASTARSPFFKWNPMVWYLKKEGVPLASAEGKSVIDRAVVGLTAEIAEARGNAQLLRASAPDQELAARELVRASGPAGIATPPEQLLRPALAAETDADCTHP